MSNPKFHAWPQDVYPNTRPEASGRHVAPLLTLLTLSRLRSSCMAGGRTYTLSRPPFSLHRSLAQVEPVWGGTHRSAVADESGSMSTLRERAHRSTRWPEPLGAFSMQVPIPRAKI